MSLNARFSKSLAPRVSLVVAVFLWSEPIVQTGFTADPVLQKIRPHWVENKGLWYVKPIKDGKSEWVWVEPNSENPDKKIVRSGSLEALEKATGLELRNRTGSGKIEPSETLDDTRIDIQIKNTTQQPIELFWVDFDGVPKTYGRLEPDQSRGQSTFPGHSWAAFDLNRKPIWTARSNRTGETLEIREMKIEPNQAAGRRGRGRRPPAQPRSNESPWKVIRDEFQLRFESPSGEVAIDTAKIADLSGSESNRYDREVHWSPDGRFAFTLQTSQGDHREITLVESSPKDQLQPKLKTIRYDKPGDKLDQPQPRLFDLEQRKAVPLDTSLFPNPWSIDNIR